MDDFEADPSGLDAPESGDAGSKLPLLALLVGVVGLIVGVAGVYMATQASNALESYQERQASAPDTTGERFQGVDTSLAEIETQLASIEERLGAIGSQQVSLQRADREIREQTQRAFEGVSREVSANRSQLNDTTAKLEELVQNLQSGAVRRNTSATAATNSGSQPSNSTSGEGSGGSSGESGNSQREGVHVVEPGDTLSKIAAAYGISLSELMAANPAVDPRRMRVGQQINIPQR